MGDHTAETGNSTAPSTAQGDSYQAIAIHLLAFLLLLLLIRAIIRRALIKPESIMLAGYFRRWPFSAVLH